MNHSELLARFQGMNALVVGDLMLDEYIFGRATRISPEAPVMVVRQQQTKNLPGGAANVARNLIALGANVSMIGVLGCDRSGETLESSLQDQGILTTGIVHEPTRITTRKTRVVADHSHQVLRIDHEDEGPISAATEAKLLEQAGNHLNNCDVVVLSDYLKGAVSPKLCEHVIASANAKGIPVVANPKPRTLSHYKGATLVSLNRLEASEALGRWQGLEDDDALQAAQALKVSIGVKNVLITLGEAGMAVFGDGSLTVPAPRVEVYDTAGAGDTVVATVALGIAASEFSEQIFTLAALTAACVVRRVGVATPSKADLASIAAN